MNSIAQAFNAFPAAVDSDILTFCEATWPLLFDQLSTVVEWDALHGGAAYSAFLRFRHWRCKTLMSDDAMICTFLLESLFRLVLVDSFTTSAEAPARDAFLAARHLDSHSLNESELKALTTFDVKSVDDFQQRLDDAADAWRAGPVEQAWPTVWSEAAYVSIFMRASGTMTSADSFFLLKMATLSALSALRYAIRASSERALDPDEAPAAWNREWPMLKSKFAGEELSNVMRRAVLATRVPCYVYRVDKDAAGKSEHELIAAWLPKYANDMKAETVGGPHATLLRGGPAAEACVLAVWDYLVQQRLKFSFKRLFWVSDYRPDAAYERVSKYMNDSIVNPPPLLVSTWDGTYVLCRHRTQPAFEIKLRYKAVGDAIDKWCRLVIERRKGVVFTNACITLLYHELFDVVAAPEGPVILQTKSLDLD
jgi:hypothetical protein